MENTTNNEKYLSVSEREQAEAKYLSQRDARQELATGVARMATAFRQKTIQEGVIAGTQYEDGCFCWKVLCGPVEVLIPIAESFYRLPDGLSVKNPNERVLANQNQFLSKAIGAKVPFLLRSMSVTPDGSYTAVASRRDALAIIRKRYFGDNAVRRLEVGMDVDARILSSGRFAAYVECCGLDVRVPNQAFSHRFIDNVSRDFAPGGEMRMRITKLGQAQGEPVMELSALPVELEALKPNLSRLKFYKNPDMNPLCSAVVTSVSVSNKTQPPSVVTRLWLNDFELPAFARDISLSQREDIRSGDTVLFRANGVTTTGYVHGQIKKLIQHR